MGNKLLAVEIDEIGALLSSIEGIEIIDKHVLEFSSQGSENKKKELNQLLSSLGWTQDNFDEITLSWSSKKSTLVPYNIFGESSPAAIFKLCFGSVGADYAVDYNRISELAVVNIYEIPDWVKSFFVMKFPKIILQHEGSHVLRNILSSNTFYLKVSIVIHQNFFMMSIVKHGNLEYYSFFDFQTTEDIIYHVLFALQQKEMINEKGTFEIISGFDSSIEVINDFKDKMTKIKDFNQLELTQPKDFIVKSQLLCV